MSYYYLKIASKLVECNLKNDKSAAPVDKAKSIVIYTGIEILNENDMYLIQVRESKSIFQNKLLMY